MVDITRMSGNTVAATDERARAAVKAFRTLQPTLSAFARALTRNNSVRVELDAGSPRTDGTRILMRPPLALGDNLKHNRSLCDKRDRESFKQLCEACAVREDVLTKVYHEIAHIAYDSFQKASNDEIKRAIMQSVKEHKGLRAEMVQAKLDSIPAYQRNSYMVLARLVSEYLPLIVNALEDARVNTQMFHARKGTKSMMEALCREAFVNGVEQEDFSIIQWRDYPLNVQAIIALFCEASDYDYSSWFQPIVIDAFTDEELLRLVGRVKLTRTASEIYSLSFDVLERLRELGFCRLPDEEPEEEEQDEAGEDTEHGEPEPGDENDQSESEGSEGQGSEDAEPDDRSSDSEDADDGDSSDVSDEAGESGSSDDSTGDSDDESSAVPDESDGDDSGESDEPGSSSETEGDAEHSDSGAAGEPGQDEGAGEEDSDDSAGSGPADSVTDSGDQEQTEGNEGTGDISAPTDTEGSHGGSGGSGGQGEEEPGTDRPADTGPSDEGVPDDGDMPGQQDSSADHDADAEPSSSGDASDNLLPSDASGQAEPTGDVSDRVGEMEDSEGDGVQGEPEPVDSGADDGDGGVRTDSLPEYGTPADVIDALKAFGGHEDAAPPTRDEVLQAEQEERAVAIAIVQGEYFEKPSTVVHDVKIYKGDRHEAGADAWNLPSHPKVTKEALVHLGVDVDITVPETILGPALLQMRRVFADNARAEHQKNLKSGRISQRVLGNRAWSDDDRLFTKKRLPGKKSYFVVIGIDVSGSTAGTNIALAKRAANAQAELCDRAGIDFAVYAHTAHYPRGGGLDLVFYEIKGADSRWDKDAKSRLERIGPDSENLDGHSIEFYRKLMDKSNATDKILLYYTDGKMPAANADEELEVMLREFKIFKQKKYTLLGVGIRTDSPRRHGLDTVQVNSDADIPAVVKHLQKRLVRV